MSKKHRQAAPEVVPIKHEIDGVAGSQIAKIQVKNDEDLQKVVEKEYRPVVVSEDQKERVTFFVVGTIMPMIDNKRVIIKGTKENGFKHSTDDVAVIAWLDKNGYKRKGAV